MADPAVEILCVLPKKVEESIESGALQYVMPLSMAKEKVMQLLEAVARGEVEYFAVNLREEPSPTDRKARGASGRWLRRQGNLLR